MVIDGADQSELLLDLIKRMLHLDPEHGIKPLEVLQHPFIVQNIPVDNEETPDQTAGPKKDHNGVNRTSFSNEQSQTSADLADNMQIYPGEVLGEFYEVVEKLGEGGFGVVTKCRNIKTNKMVAIICMLNHCNIVEQALTEIDTLEKLQCLDPDTCNII